VILNYNGKDLTDRCIDSLFRSIENIDYEIIVIDNGSDDESADYLEKKYSFIKVLREGKNKYISAYNDGVKEASKQWVFLLNNDMTFEKGFIVPILEHISHSDVFAVGSKMLRDNGDFEKCVNIPVFRFGYLRIKSVDVNELTPSVYIGTHGAFNREKFIEIGGFDGVYSPFYSEDVDLCYRAWKRGWKTYVEPRSIIYHKHMATIGRLFKRRYVLRISARNHFIFLWKNITSKKIILYHIVFLPIILLGAILMGKYYYIPGFFEALMLLLRGKIDRDKTAIKTDEEIFSYFRKFECLTNSLR